MIKKILLLLLVVGGSRYCMNECTGADLAIAEGAEIAVYNQDDKQMTGEELEAWIVSDPQLEDARLAMINVHRLLARRPPLAPKRPIKRF